MLSVTNRQAPTFKEKGLATEHPDSLMGVSHLAYLSYEKGSRQNSAALYPRATTGYEKVDTSVESNKYHFILVGSTYQFNGFVFEFIEAPKF